MNLLKISTRIFLVKISLVIYLRVPRCIYPLISPFKNYIDNLYSISYSDKFNGFQNCYQTTTWFPWKMVPKILLQKEKCKSFSSFPKKIILEVSSMIPLGFLFSRNPPAFSLLTIFRRFIWKISVDAFNNSPRSSFRNLFKDFFSNHFRISFDDSPKNCIGSFPENYSRFFFLIFIVGFLK